MACDWPWRPSADAAGRRGAGAGGHRGGDRARRRPPRVAFLAALAGSVLIQIGTNLANDYSDAKRGADTEDRLGPVRVTSSALVAPRRVLVATWLAFAAAVAVGIYLPTVAGPVILARRRALDPRRRPLHRRPAALRIRRAWASSSSSSSSAWSPSTAPTTSSSRSSTGCPFRPLDRGRAAVDGDPRRQQRPRRRHRPPRRQEHARRADRPRAGPRPLRGPGRRRLRRPAADACWLADGPVLGAARARRRAARGRAR